MSLYIFVTRQSLILRIHPLKSHYSKSRSQILTLMSYIKPIPEIQLPDRWKGNEKGA